MERKEGLGVKGIWEISTFDVKTGRIKEKEVKENMIVNTGLERLAKLLNGVSTVYFDYIAIGSGNTDPAETDTTLESELSRLQADTSYESDYKSVLEKTFLFTSAQVIREAGCFSSDDIMLNRVTFSDKNVDENTGLHIKFWITVSRV